MSSTFPAPTPERLREIWRDILGLHRIDDDDAFFALGGRSVEALRLVNRIRSVFGLEVTIRTVIEAPTVAGLVEALRQAPAALTRPPLTKNWTRE